MIHFRHDRARQSLPSARIIQQTPPKLVAIVTRACAEAGVSPSRFGRDAVNDSRLVRDLAAGRQPRPATRAAIIAHLNRLGRSAVRNG